MRLGPFLLPNPEARKCLMLTVHFSPHTIALPSLLFGLGIARLGVGGIPIALRAGARHLGGREDALAHRLPDLGPSKHETGDKTNKDGRNTAESDGSVEEDKSGEGNGQLVEGSDHGVGGGRGCADAPGGAVRDEDGGETGVDHTDVKGVPGLLGEVPRQVLGGPILSDQGADDKHGDTERVVVEHGWRQVC